jgi:tripartite-type tricarboxylate transporter receptor subunit TctC
MLKKVIVILASVSIFVMFIGACAPVQQPKGASEFYKENAVLMIIPAGEGGVTDLIARLVTQHWGQITGGQMSVKNIASGGHIEGTNFVYKAKPDGLTMGIGMGGTIQSPALGVPGVEWDPTKFTFILYMAPSEPTMVSFGANSQYSTLDDLKNAKTIKLGTTGIDNSQAMFGALLAEALQLKDFKIVSGYKATPDMMLAAAKGEVDIAVNSGEIVREYIGKKMLKEPFLNMQVEKHPIWKNVPQFIDVVKLSPALQASYDTVITGYAKFGADKLFFVPPGVPADRVEYLRETFYKMATSENFIKDLVKLQPDRWSIFLGPPTKGAAIAEDASKAYSLVKANQPTLRALINKYLAIK